MHKKLTTAATSAATFLSMATPVFAQNLNVNQPDGFNITDLGALISSLIAIALIVAGILVFVYLVWGGMQWITSGGDKGKTEEARSRITAALVGLAIVASAWAVMQLVSYFFGLQGIGGDAPLPRPF